VGGETIRGEEMTRNRALKVILMTILGIALIGAAGCSVSDGSGLAADADIAPAGDGSVDIGTGWFEGDEAFEDDGDEVVAEGEDEGTDEDGDFDVDVGSDDSGESAECAYPMHVIETGMDEISVMAGTETEISINVTGGSGNFRWYDLGTDLPAGMTFEEGDTVSSITGAPIEDGVFQVSIRVKDLVCERHATKDISIEVNSLDLVSFVPADDLPSVAIDPNFSGRPFVKFTIKEAGSEEMRSFVLHEDSVREIEVFRGLQPVMISAATTISDGETGTDFDRYEIEVLRITIDPYDFYPRDFHMPNNTAYPAFVTSPNPGIVHCQFKVKDTTNDSEYTYFVILKVRCKFIPLKDAHIRLIAKYTDDTNDAYCNKNGSSTSATKAGLGLTSSTKAFKTEGKNEEGKFKAGYYTHKYELTSQGKNSSHENVIKHNPKVVRWGPDNRHAGICLEDIKRAGVYLDDDGCTGKPDLYVAALEVKACRDKDKIEAGGGKHGCYFASFRGSAGVSNVGNYKSKKKTFWLDENKDGKIWSEKSEVEYIFEHYDVY
jgi:hypothetical protein